MKKKIKLLSYLFLFTIISLSVGYSAFGTKMNITDIVAEVRIKKDIRVTNFSVKSATGNAISQYEEYNYNSVSSTINMPEATSSITYNVEVTNIGNVEMGIYEFIGLPDNMEIVMSDDYALKDSICDDTKCKLGAKKTFPITIKYKDGGFNSSTTEYNVKLDVDFRQMYSVTYEGITNHDYQSKVIEGDTLSVTFTEDIPEKAIPYSNGVKLSNYTYENNQVTVENISSDTVIKYIDKVYLRVLSPGEYFKEENYINTIKTASFVNYVDTTDSLVTYELGETGYENEIIGWIDSNYNLYIGSDWDIYTKSLESAFQQMNTITSISFDNLNTSENTSLKQTFYKCHSLINIDLTNFNTSNVADMYGMFSRCYILPNIDLSNFDTSNVTNMGHMFYDCFGLSHLDVSNFITTKVTNMSVMFGGNNEEEGLEEYNFKLTSLDLSNFDTSSVENMYKMFQYQESLTYLNIDSFDTSKVKNMSYMFRNCSSITNINVSHFVTTSATTMSNMFTDCRKMESINVSNFNINSVTDLSCMFLRCTSLKSLDLTNFNTSKVTTLYAMFTDCHSLETLTIDDNFTTEEVISTRHMFVRCYKLKYLDLSTFSLVKVKDVHRMFEDCGNLETLVLNDNFLPNSNTVTNLERFFLGCHSLKNINLKGFDTSKVTNMNQMFGGCRSLETIDVSNFNTSNVTDMSYMFSDCRVLEKLDISNFDISNVTNMEGMFKENAKLINLNLNNLDITKVENTIDMFYDNSSNITITVKDEANKTLVESLLSNGGTVVTI